MTARRLLPGLAVAAALAGAGPAVALVPLAPGPPAGGTTLRRALDAPLLEAVPPGAFDPAAAAMAAAAGGQWRSAVDRRTGRLGRLWGSGAPVPDEPAAREARVRALLAALEPFHGALAGELVLSAARSTGSLDGTVAFVDFDRVVAGVPVHGSRAWARINHGRLVMLGFERMFPLAGSETVPRLGAGEALAAARTRGGGPTPADIVVEPGRLVVWPYLGADGLRHAPRLVWEVAWRRPPGRETWTARVDARSGEVLEWFDANAYTTGTVTGVVHPRTVGDPDATVPFPHEYVKIANRAPITTGTNGTYSGTGSGDVNFLLDGLTPPGGFKVVNVLGPEASYTDTSGAPVVDHLWTDATSRADERNAFHHLHVVRSRAQALVSPAWLGTLVTAYVNDNDTCNAYFDGALHFFPDLGFGCANSAEIGDIVYHEWGHGLDVNHGGAPDCAAGEGIGDITAWLVTRDPILGPGFLDPVNPPLFPPMDDVTAVRDASKLISAGNIAERCPVAGCLGPLGYESHCEGQVLSGAAFDLVMLLRSRYGETAAFDLVSRLHHVSLPSWQTHLEAADAWLAVDDDNGNLLDGTPNGCLIFEAFDRHGTAGMSVPCSTPLVRLELASTRIDDSGGDGDGFPDAGETVRVALSVRNRGNSTGSAVQATATTSFPGVSLLTPTATFPAIAAGATVESRAPHLVVAIDGTVACGSRIPFELTMRDGVSSWGGSFALVVGRPGTVWLAQGFEAGAGGWTGNSGTAVRGQWLAGTPRLTAQAGDVWQPGSAPEGASCFYTGANLAWYDVSNDDVDGGTALAVSPAVDLRAAVNPVLQFRYWFASLLAGTQPSDIFEAEIAAGATVVRVFSEAVSKSEWRWASVPLFGRVALGNNMRVRFKATDDPDPYGNIVEAAVDDVRIVEFDCASVPACPHSASVAASGTTALCRGESVGLDATVTGCAGTPSYQWVQDGLDIPGATGPSYTVPGTLAPGSHAFEVRTECSLNPGCTVTAGPVTVEVSEAVAAVLPPGPLELCAGDAATLDGDGSSVQGCPGGRLLQWRLDGGDLPGETGPTWSVPPALAPAEHTVELVASCASNPRCADVAALAVSVARARAAVVDPGPVAACAGDTVGLDGTPSSVENCPGGATYEWRLAGAPIPGASAPTYTTPPLAAGSYDYELVVACASRPACTSSSGVIAVTASAGVAPDVRANSLRAVRRAGAAEVTWSSSGTGSWNLHRTAVKSELADLWLRPVLLAVTATAASDPDPAPAGGPWHYQAFGADCRGVSQP